MLCKLLYSISFILFLLKVVGVATFSWGFALMPLWIGLGLEALVIVVMLVIAIIMAYLS